MPPAITANALSKQYELGAAGPGGLREALRNAARFPVALLRGERRPRPTVWALRDATFQVDEGEVLGIIGRNGAGKSTLLKLLTRIVEPTSGTAEVFGRVGSLLEVGTGFHPELTGRENVYLNGAILGMRKAEVTRKFDEIVAFSGVETFLDTQVKFYSSGMYLRLAFAVAAHLEPEVLLVDEVLAVGDIEFQAKCLDKMQAVSRGGRTVVLVSHQLNAIRSLCSHVLWLDQGRVRLIGRSEDVIAAYEADSLARQAEGTTNGFESWRVVGASTPREQHVVRGSLDPVGFAFRFVADRSLTHVTITLSLTDDRARIVWSADPRVDDLAAGPSDVVVSLGALPLRPGAYRWRINLFEGRKMIDEWHAVPPLVVTATTVSHSRDEWMGVLNLPGEVRVTPVTDPSS